eukprot:COSAG01_NODE_63347_length_280_cov_0.861878_1_plen_93_part_11
MNLTGGASVTAAGMGMVLDDNFDLAAGGTLDMVATDLDLSLVNSAQVHSNAIRLEAVSTTDVFSGSSVTVTTTDMLAHSFEDTVLTAGERVTV